MYLDINNIINQTSLLPFILSQSYNTLVCNISFSNLPGIFVFIDSSELLITHIPIVPLIFLPSTKDKYFMFGQSNVLALI